MIACFICQVFANTAETSVKTVDFDVPPGIAKSTLKTAAQQADVDIIFAGNSVRGVVTPALKGEYIPEEAFDLMLADTTLAVSQHEETGVYIVKKDAESAPEPESYTPMKKEKSKLRSFFKGFVVALTTTAAGTAFAQDANDDIYTLDPFKVEVTNEAVQVEQSISATRFATDLDELPFAVNVLTRQLVEDLQVTDVKDLVQFAGNVVTGEGTQAFGTTTNNQVRLRGFPTTQNLINGFSVGTGFAIAPNSIQRVEVVKGPASLLYGAIPPGGVINFMTKRPQAEFGGSVDFIVGTWNYRRIDADVTGPLTENIRYLINLSQEDRDFFWVGQTREALHINPVFEFDFAERKGNVLVDFYHSRVDQAGVNAGLPRAFDAATYPDGRKAHMLDIDYPVPNFNIRDRGAPQWNETDSIYLRYRYSFNDTYTLRAAFRDQSSDNERINQAIGSLPIFNDFRPGRTSPKPGDANYGISGTPQWDRQGGWGNSTNIQLNLLMDYQFEWGSIQVMPGFDYNENDGWFWRFRAGNIGEDGRRAGNYRSRPKDIFNPDTWVFDAPGLDQYIVDDPATPQYEGPGLLRNNSGNDGSSEDFYVYGSTNLLDDNLIVTAGFRESSFENAPLTTPSKGVPTASDIVAGDPLTGSDSIYQYGAVYKIVPETLHLYGNFAQSFQPQLRTIQLPDADGNPFDVDTDGDGINDAPLLNDNPRVPADHLFGEGWETGIKGNLIEGKLGYSVAYFTTTNNNIIRNITVSNNPANYETWYPNLDPDLAAALPDNERIDEFQIQSGEEEAKGYEFEIMATPLDGWDIRATYTMLDTALVVDPSAPQAIGRTLPNSPEDNFNIFTRYAFRGNLEGFFLGGSMDHMSSRISNAPQSGSAGLFARSRTLFNAFAGYRFSKGDYRYRLQFNVQNATGEFVAQGNHLGAFYPPRHYRFTAGVDF